MWDRVYETADWLERYLHGDCVMTEARMKRIEQAQAEHVDKLVDLIQLDPHLTRVAARKAGYRLLRLKP